jgi:hypothetical protein
VDCVPIKPGLEAADDRARLVGMANVISLLLRGDKQSGDPASNVAPEAPARSDGIVESGLVRGFSGGGTR